jgi:hypothetical protein
LANRHPLVTSCLGEVSGAADRGGVEGAPRRSASARLLGADRTEDKQDDD